MNFSSNCAGSSELRPRGLTEKATKRALKEPKLCFFEAVFSFFKKISNNFSIPIAKFSMQIYYFSFNQNTIITEKFL